MSHDPSIDGDRAVEATASIADRQEAIETLVVEYDRYKATIEALRDHHWPLAGGTFRTGTIRGIIGPSRAGKSWATRSYLNSLGKVASNPHINRALYVDAALGWSSLNLANGLLDQLALPVRVRGTVASILDKIRGEIAASGVELVVIDDAQFLLGARQSKTVAETIGFITRLAEMKTCNIVLAGTREVTAAIRNHPHAYNRGSFPRHELRGYDWANPEDREHFGFLLMKIDERLPFRRLSNLAAPKRAAHFFPVSDGLIGIVMDYVKDAAMLAMRAEADRIETEHLVDAAAMRRREGDPFEPFVSRIDQDDPTGSRRALEEEMLHAEAPRPTLSKRRRQKFLE